MNRSLVALLSALCAFAVAAPAASAGTLERPKPEWLTPALEAEIHSAGADGVQVAEEYLNTECPGFQQPGVQANACIVSPAGCTGNFIFASGSTRYLGTAAHCTDKVGDTVIIQVDTTTLVEVGKVAKRTSTEEPGADAAIITIDPAVAAKWGINPAMPFLGGPQGVYTGCEPTGVKSYGHGYGVAVGQGKPNLGVATVWYDDGYGWNGTGLPGDSGSGVLTADGQAAGNLTHLIIYDPAYTPANVAGTRASRILSLFGVLLVNADGSMTGASATSCGSSDAGGGNGKGGNGNGKPPKKNGKGGSAKRA